jgi:hypothetical protein
MNSATATCASIAFQEPLVSRDVSRRGCACEPAIRALRKWLSGHPQGPTVLRWD